MQMYSVYFLFVHLSKLFTYQPVKLFRFLKYANRDSQCTLGCDHSEPDSFFYVSNGDLPLSLINRV